MRGDHYYRHRMRTRVTRHEDEQDAVTAMASAWRLRHTRRNRVAARALYGRIIDIVDAKQAAQASDVVSGASNGIL